MKIVLIYPDINEGAGYSGAYYTGMGILSAVLRQAGHGVQLLHITQPITEEGFYKRIEPMLPEKGPILIGFSITSNMLPFLETWSKWIKMKWAKAIIIAGGVHPTLTPEDTIALPSVDIVCVGEGEGAIVELTDSIAKGEIPTGIRNLWIKQTDGKVEKNPLRPLVDLDSLPIPDRDIYDFINLHNESRGEANLVVSRGCPYHCTYCCNDALREVNKGLGRPVRFRSVPLVIEEIKSIVHDYPSINRIVFCDDILPLWRKWFSDFSKTYASEIAIPFTCNLRPNLVNEEIVSELKQAGCVEIRFGLESGNDDVREKIMNRQLTREQMLYAFRVCKNAGIKTFAFNIVGLPGECVEQMLDTVKLNADVMADVTRVTIFYPYPKTKLYDLCAEMNILTDHVVIDYAQDSMLDFSKTHSSRVLFIRRYFPILVKVYRFLRVKQKVKLEKCLDKLMVAPWSAKLVYPLLNKLYELVRNSAALDRWAMAFRRKFFG
ncbi:MAG: B12-binding domain-containing radical SAM protein [Anaerolineaceae bacterium]|nr:B12-binding domain-containing radical SAM protein [Anaerolineaceae bacterium]